MSSPIRKIFSSRSISSSSASRSAARNSFSGIFCRLPFAGVEVAIEFVDLRIRALVGELDDLLDLLFDLRSNLFQVFLGGDSRLLQLRLEAEHRIFVPPALLFLVRAVLVRVHHGVALGAVVDRLDEAGLR